MTSIWDQVLCQGDGRIHSYRMYTRQFFQDQSRGLLYNWNVQWHQALVTALLEELAQSAGEDSVSMCRLKGSPVLFTLDTPFPLFYPECPLSDEQILPLAVWLLWTNCLATHFFIQHIYCMIHLPCTCSSCLRARKHFCINLISSLTT